MANPLIYCFEFHISRQARDRYQFDETLFLFSGNVIFANFHSARVFTQKMNKRRDLIRFPEKAIRAGQLNAMGLIDEILHLVVESYRLDRNPSVMESAITWLEGHIGDKQLSETLQQFISLFPPLSVYSQQLNILEYLEGFSQRSDGSLVSNRQIALEELLMLWLANMNPAFSPFLELFDDQDLKKNSDYIVLIESLHQFFDTQTPYGPDNQNLMDMLREPAIAVPHSLSGQLEFIRTRWANILGKFLYRLLSSLDLIKEEEKAIFFGPGPTQVYEFGGLLEEPERFSRDADWMPNLVLLAKNTYVWLDQMSKKYGYSITRLDQIPEEELEMLARGGFSGLWLIGLWERSLASRTIKQICGNPDAVASAYSLLSYDIAQDLGGDEAYQGLRQKAWKFGIRLASDMVPNHMGTDSRWVIEHPDWFISLDYSPFPSYSFNGRNLSWDERIGIYLEDHYYNDTDAAVVFKRVDFWTGSEKFIYHGNDGTSMPWNDTAQLNFLLADVREAVIQTILHVARKFPIIRFDAAMTLAKKHYQRLWFPEPGSGGDIPSRSEFGLTKEQFNQAFPVEFWREVVDRVANEAPDTLLLAEAFWLMEGYFVRTLGMHRVYNSAFMNMLRDEKNQEYRQVIKNTLEFDPQILKRYVNFMNNPDERTAVDQFGKGDKYFGICTLLATMPGLPMFGHGQMEGYTEKYGMEYRRAYWDETPDPYLVERHEREIFPLLRRRHLFAGVQGFLLYDFYSPEGYVNEDVYAYSNQVGEERALVVFHNKYAQARGWIRISAAFPIKTETRNDRQLIQKTLGEGLLLQDDSEVFTIFRDHINGLQYMRRNNDLHHQGMYIELGAYQYQVFLDFRQVQETQDRRYGRLETYLQGRGVPSIDEALTELMLQAVHQPYRQLVNSGMLDWIIKQRAVISEENLYPESYEDAMTEASNKIDQLLLETSIYLGASGDISPLSNEMKFELKSLLDLPTLEKQESFMLHGNSNALVYFFAGPDGQSPIVDGTPLVWGPLLSWLLTYRLGELMQGVHDPAQLTRSWMDEWLLHKLISEALHGMGLDLERAQKCSNLVGILTKFQHDFKVLDEQSDQINLFIQDMLSDVDIQRYLQIHRYQDVLWFNKESFEELVWWMFALSVFEISLEENRIRDQAKLTARQKSHLANRVQTSYKIVQQLLLAESESGYRVEEFLEIIG